MPFEGVTIENPLVRYVFLQKINYVNIWPAMVSEMPVKSP